MNDERLQSLRERMIEEQLRWGNISDERVLWAMAKVPREAFVNSVWRERAYDDTPLPIGYGQTMSQPWIVARTLEMAALHGDERVLDVGAGSGYQTALLCELCREVYAVECLPDLARALERRLARLGYHSAVVSERDGSAGWSEHAPFDAILVAAGAPSIPALLVAQLADGGRLVIPVGPRGHQRLGVVIRHGERFDTSWGAECTFVDLVGRYGFGGEGPAQA